MPIDAEVEAAVAAMRSVRTMGAKVHEEVLRAYAIAAVQAAENARVEDFVPDGGVGGAHSLVLTSGQPVVLSTCVVTGQAGGDVAGAVGACPYATPGSAVVVPGRASRTAVSVPTKNAAEFIALAKANPGKINMGSGGVGSTGHLGGELLQMMAGIKLAHVPYRGEAPAMTDLIAGHCQMVIATTGSALEYCKAGSVRAIAVTLDMKLDSLPDVKPLSNLLPGYMAIGWSGLVAPKNVPADIVALLHKHGSDALAQPNIRQRVIDMGGVVPGGTAADFGQFMAEDTERWAKVIKVAGIKVN